MPLLQFIRVLYQRDVLETFLKRWQVVYFMGSLMKILARWKNTILNDKMSQVFLTAGIFFTIVFLFYYPAYIVSTDEHAYMKNSFLLHTGSTKTTDNQLYCGGNSIGNGQYISALPIGKSLALFPFTFLPLDLVFLSGLLTHLLNFILFILIFKKLNVSKYWALLYLFFPAFQWESRTLFSELTVLTLFAGAYLLWLHGRNRWYVIAGALLGLATFVRYDAGAGFLAFAASALLFERKKLIPFLAGAAPVLVAHLLFNFFTYGGVLNVGYGSVGSVVSNGLNPRYFSELAILLGVIFIVLPLSWLSLTRKYNHTIIFAVVAVVSVLFFSQYSYFFSFETSLPHLLTARLRYFIPILGMLLIPTAQLYEDLLRKLAKKIPHITHTQRLAVMALFVLVIAGGTIELHKQHARLGDARGAVLSEMQKVIPENSRVIGERDLCIFFVYPATGKKYFIPADTVTPTPPLKTGDFVVEINYFSQAPNDTVRQEVIDRDHTIVREYVETHAQDLILVSTLQGDADLNIWRAK